MADWFREISVNLGCVVGFSSEGKSDFVLTSRGMLIIIEVRVILMLVNCLIHAREYPGTFA